MDILQNVFKKFDTKLKNKTLTNIKNFITLSFLDEISF